MLGWKHFCRVSRDHSTGFPRPLLCLFLLHRDGRVGHSASQCIHHTTRVISFNPPSGPGRSASLLLLSCFSCVWLFVTPWTVACQALLFMRFSMQEHWSGLLCPPSGDLPYPGIQPASLTSPALAGRFFTTSATWEAPECSLAGTKSDKWKVEHLEDGFTDHDEVPQTFPSQQICPSLIKKKKSLSDFMSIFFRK